MAKQHKNSNNATRTYKAPKKTSKKKRIQSLVSTSIAQIVDAKFPSKNILKTLARRNCSSSFSISKQISK